MRTALQVDAMTLSLTLSLTVSMVDFARETFRFPTACLDAGGHNAVAPEAVQRGFLIEAHSKNTMLVTAEPPRSNVSAIRPESEFESVDHTL